VDTPLDSTAGGRPIFHTTQWLIVAAASAEGTAQARAALEELYRFYCYPVYAFIRRRGYGRQDAQDLTQDFFVHLLEKGTLSRAEGLTAEKLFDAQWAAALVEATFARLRCQLESEGKGHVFEALQGFLAGKEEPSFRQVANALKLSLGALKTAIHRLRNRHEVLLRDEVARTVATPAEVDEELRYLRATLGG
jgi:DNA-directed RNA polymerase specialized sigma24 family protein